MAATVIGICGFAGLVMDVGYGEYVHRQAQAAADAGAKAAAFEIVANQSSAVITAAAKQDTANNGFTDQVGGVTVAVNQPPLSGSYASKSGYAEVIVTRTVPTSFMAILGFSSMNIAARGVSGGGPGTSCIYALNAGAKDAIEANGNVSVDMTCGITVESSNSAALETKGGACITSTFIRVVGGYNGGCLTPTPASGTAASSDPLAGKYPRPTPGSCTATNWHNNSASISPGTYCGGITIDGGQSVTANPGMYILYGGGLTIAGGGSLSGSGITFFNMDGGSYGTYQPFSLAGNSTTQMVAPTSGTYEGLLFYQDPNLPSKYYSKVNSVSGGSSTVFQGTMYLPNTPLTYTGTSSAAYTIIVADTIKFSGTSSLNADYSSLSNGNPIRDAGTLVE
jgi:hypothetical protein